MHKRVAGILLSGSAAALAIGLSATSALAATSLTVKVTGGGKSSASASSTVLKDGAVSVTCSTKSGKAASTASTTVSNGTKKGNAPLKIGTAASLKFNNCTGPLGAVTAKPVGTFSVNANSKTNGSGQTDATISGIKVNVSMTACSFVVTGSAPGVYSNTKHTLTMTPKPPSPLTKAQLTVSGVKGCAGVVKNGDHPTYSSTYTLKPATLTIKSS